MLRTCWQRHDCTLWEMPYIMPGMTPELQVKFWARRATSKEQERICCTGWRPPQQRCHAEIMSITVTALQALQLQLLRRLLQQMLGASYSAALPELLLEDAGLVAGSCSPCADNGLPGKRLRMLQELQAMAASSWPAQLAAGG